MWFLLLGVTLAASAALSWLLLSDRAESQEAEGRDSFFESLVDTEQTSEAFSGEGPGYRWSQTDAEVEVAVTVDALIKARDVQCDITPRSLLLICAGTSILQGRLFRNVKSGESDWKLEGTGSARTLTISLPKVAPTRGNQHWTSLFELPEG